ncbi:transposase [Saccharopolyspora phatthalungensis]|uniref:Transposase n=1 Tax=Saccharopolyspora phatthalungensis TaxID=664693 RepID=A0A840Q4E9_9PSEU|nr:transposase [Saccharopolyspora phatthalungensis]MBB5154521.1 transposase [Saccharopolyspora phatthalungensis]MBB5155052.1 transposase [Saccharopolyspora phatthalungensis]
MPHVRALTRGDRRRNERLTRLRSIVRREFAVVAVDLASAKQAAVVADHDSRVLGRRMFSGDAWVIDDILDWAGPVAAKAGFAGVVLGCEPTGHRWKPLLDRARARGVELVCVNPMLVHRGREEEDFTRDRSDFKDATIIAKRVAELRCYVPYVLEGHWCRLRHLGARRADQLVAAGSARQRLRDLLECAWPAVLSTASKPLDTLTWRVAMAVSTDPARIMAMGFDAFAAAVRDELPRWGGSRRNLRILRAIFDAARTPGGVATEQAAACERAAYALDDWHHALGQLADVEARMIEVLDTLELSTLVTTITGLSVVGAAAILAETGDPARFDCARTWVKHAGLCPRANESGNFHGITTVSRRGRPGLRTAAWRAIWGALTHNPVYTARYTHLTTRETNPLRPGQARTALAAALLRQLFVVVTRRVAWDPAVAAGTTKEVAPQAA